jgi:HPt (histidine-containing phosphotransfer) domain-containing protein
MNDANLDPPLLLDEEIIAELREVMEGEFANLIDSFLTDLPMQLDYLQAAIFQDSAGEVYRIAHKLKSSCSALGALRLAEWVRRLEMAGRQNALDHAPELLDTARTVAQETIAGLRMRLE